MVDFLQDLLGAFGSAGDDQGDESKEVVNRLLDYVGDENGVDQATGSITAEGLIVKKRKEAQSIALKGSKRKAHEWTPKLQKIATSDQIRYTTTSLLTKKNDVRNNVEVYKPDVESLDLLSALEASGVVQDRCVTLNSLKPSEKMQEERVAKEQAREKGRLRTLLIREQKKAAYNNRQKGKLHRRTLKKRLQREEDKLVEALAEENPELVAKIRKDYEDKRAALRMMPNHGKRRKWARIATKFGGGDAVADDAARHFEDKREVTEVLKRMEDTDRTTSNDGDSGSVSDDEDYDSEGGSDSSDSEVSMDNVAATEKDWRQLADEAGVGDIEKDDDSSKSRKRSQPDASNVNVSDKDNSNTTAKKKRLKTSLVPETDLSGFLKNDRTSNQRALVTEMFTGSGVADEKDAIESIAQREVAELDDAEKKDGGMEISMMGWGGAWAGSNYKEKLVQNQLDQEAELKDYCNQKKKRPIYVNRKLSKKFEKYFVKDVPQGYANAAEYTLKMRDALGPEWSTGTGSHDRVKPKVYVENGAVIQPLGRTEVVLGHKKSRTHSRL